MQRSDRESLQDEETNRSRAGSRRNSASSRRNSLKKEKKSPLNSGVTSANTTPKKVQRVPNVDFMVTGKQIMKRYDRANSLPVYNRRPSSESAKKKPMDSIKKTTAVQTPKSRDTSLEDDMSLDLSQVSDFEDNSSKYGLKFAALATSTPKQIQKRSGSVQSQMSKIELLKRNNKSFDSRQSTLSYSRDSLYKTSSSASPYRAGMSTEDYSSVSPEYSGQSSADLSPKGRGDVVATPQELQMSSCCVSTWQECSDCDSTKVENNGEWDTFWANYNNSVSKVPMKCYYDQCPTPYRTDNLEINDFAALSTSGSRKRSPEHVKHINSIIRNEGLQLTPRETQSIIKCAHLLGNVLSKAIERRSKEKDLIDETNGPEVETKKKTLTLDLKETALPVEAAEEKRWGTATTQTDISLPNTKSAPKIFENILRQLSKSSIDEGIEPRAPPEETVEDVNKEIDNEDKKEN